MGGCCSSSNIESSDIPGEKAPSPQPTSTPAGTTSTQPSRPGTAASSRARAQSQGAALSQRRHDVGRITRLRHLGAMYSPRNIQIARKCLRANIHPVERVLWSGPDLCRWIRQLCRVHHRIRLFEGVGRHLRPYMAVDTNALPQNPCQVCPQRQAKFEPGDMEADHVSLSLCRTHFPTTSGMQSNIDL